MFTPKNTGCSNHYDLKCMESWTTMLGDEVTATQLLPLFENAREKKEKRHFLVKSISELLLKKKE